MFDINLNTYYSFSENAASGTYDIQSIFKHKLGHALRVDHSTVSSDTMYANPSLASTNWRTTTAADQAAVQDSTARWFN